MNKVRWFIGIVAIGLVGLAFGIVKIDHASSKATSSSTPIPAVISAATAAPLLTPPPLPNPVLPTPTGKVQVRILMYHYIRTVDVKKDPLGFRLSVTPTDFDQQLTELQAEGFQAITMRDFEQGKGGDKTVVLTFDDGYEDFYTTAWPLLKKHGFTATAYIISAKIGNEYMTWDQLRELDQAGIEIGAHTVHHVDLSKSPPEVQHAEIFGSKATIEQELKTPVVSFCYPSGKYNDLTLSLTKQAGYLSATTTHPGIAQVGDNQFTLSRMRMTPGLGGQNFDKLLH